MPTPTGTVFTVTDLSGATYNIHGVLYGTCETAAGTAAKVVTISGITSLDEGLSIRVKFTYAQTYDGTPTLNVNNLGAKNIKRVGSINAKQYEWREGEIIDFVYDGLSWIIVKVGIQESIEQASIVQMVYTSSTQHLDITFDPVTSTNSNVAEG